MPFFPVDDQMPFHPKILAAGNGAVGLWARTGAWCKNHASGGFVPTQAARSMGTKAEIKRLLDVGLWDEVLGGYLFHDWEHYGNNAPAVEEEAKKEAKREADRLRKQRQRQKESDTEADVTRDSHAMSRVTSGGQDGGAAVTQIDRHAVTAGVTSRASRARSRPVPSPVPSVVDLDLDPSVPETSRDTGMDLDPQSPTEVDYVARAAKLRVDFRKVAARLELQAQEAVDDAIVWRVIWETLDRSRHRPGDRTGLILTSIREDWPEWSRLVYSTAGASA